MLLLLACGALAAPAVTFAGRPDGGGSPGGGQKGATVILRGAKYSQSGAALVELRLTKNNTRYEYRWPRGTRFSWAKHPNLCEPTTKGSTTTYITSHAFYPRAVGVVRNGRADARGHRGLVIGRRERIRFDGRLTGPRRATVTFTFSVQLRSGPWCKKVWHLKLRPGQYPQPPPAKPRPPEDNGNYAADMRTGTPGSSTYVEFEMSVFRNEGRGVWTIQGSVENACGETVPEPGQPRGTVISSGVGFFAEVPIQGEHIEVSATPVDPNGKGSGTFSISADHVKASLTQSPGVRGTFTPNISFTGDCPGSYTTPWQFGAF